MWSSVTASDGMRRKVQRPAKSTYVWLDRDLGVQCIEAAISYGRYMVVVSNKSCGSYGRMGSTM
jgi:hypothetical protein